MASNHPYFFFREELLRLFSVTPPFLASGERAQKVHMKMNMNKISAMYNDDNSKNLPAMSSQPLSFAYPSLLRKDVQHVTQHAPSAFPGSKENQPGLGAYFDNNIAAMLAAAGTVSAPPIAHMPDFSANPLAALLLQEAALQNRMHQTPIPPSIHFKQAMNAQADKPMYNQLSLTKAKTSSDYVDFAKLYSTESLKKDKNFNRSKKSSFPMKLYSILKDNEFSDCISWMPHGRSWKVLDQAKFEQKVIPLFFRHAKMASFMRQVCCYFSFFITIHLN